MTDEQLEKIRKKYEKMIGDRDMLKATSDRMHELEQMPEVKEYKELLEKYNGYHGFHRDDIVDRTDYDILSRLAHTCTITPTTNIYFYAATKVKYINGDSDFVDEAAKDDIVLAYYFKNAETEHNVFTIVLPEELEEFNKNNVVIYPTNKYDSGTFYQEANDYFIVTEVEKGKEEAVEEFKQYAKTGYPWNVH